MLFHVLGASNLKSYRWAEGLHSWMDIWSVKRQEEKSVVEMGCVNGVGESGSE